MVKGVCGAEGGLLGETWVKALQNRRVTTEIVYDTITINPIVFLTQTKIVFHGRSDQ